MDLGLVSQLVLSAQSTTKDYIRAEHKLQSVSELFTPQVIIPEVFFPLKPLLKFKNQQLKFAKTLPQCCHSVSGSLHTLFSGKRKYSCQLTVSLAQPDRSRAKLSLIALHQIATSCLPALKNKQINNNNNNDKKALWIMTMYEVTTLDVKIKSYMLLTHKCA